MTKEEKIANSKKLNEIVNKILLSGNKYTPKTIRQEREEDKEFVFKNKK